MSIVGAILLAAGKSSRMGRNKMLEPVAGKAVILHVMDALTEAQLAGAIVALGHEREQITPLLAGYDCTVVLVPDYRDGLARSLSAALAVAPSEWDAAFICLGDMPLINPLLLQEMKQAARPDTIVIPSFEGKMGNPVLWGREFFPELRKLQGDSGGRQLFSRYEDNIRLHLAPNDSIFLDLDTEADLARIVRHVAG